MPTKHSRPPGTTNPMTWTKVRLQKQNPKKSGQKLEYQLTAPSIKWPWAWKHSGMVGSTSKITPDTIGPTNPMTWTYRLLQEDYKKKAVRGPKINQLTSTINKMAMGLETLRNGGQGLQKTI